ncbi:xylulose kinase-like [Lineus longissimus]|uniref:xylulose kinase-like n=1 Tax=Lineus longissimus TaxID=88925 RepID=UPI00315CF7B5
MAGSDVAKLFLGVEISTQQVKVIAVDNELSIVYENAVKYDTELPHYGTHGGAHIHEDNHTVTAPTLMWVEAVDLVLSKMKNDGFDFSKVVALSGTGQQHGSVYWKRGAVDILSNMEPEKSLKVQLQECFSVADSPIWMDSSTTAICHQLEESVGGAQRLASLSGSIGVERFTGPQIAKISRNKPDAYHDTERISLVSSFGASLFLGAYAGIDFADCSGMNLLNIHKKQWEQGCVDFCGAGLVEKLGDPIPSYQNLGPISRYFVDRYKFHKDCAVIAFTGDNPASLAGMRLEEGDIIVTLGTSDCAFVWLREPRPSHYTNICCNPVVRDDYFAMIVFKNGSLTRERIRDECAEASWDRFEELLKQTPKGNDGNIGFYYDVEEIIPSNAKGVHRFDATGKKVGSFSNATEIRALIEGQFLAKRLHAENSGFKIEPNTRILATGGASANKAILQVLADVFNAPVFTLDVANSACLGCAYRAKHGLLGGEKFAFVDIVKNAPGMVLAVAPSPGAYEVYTPMVAMYRKLETIVSQS